MLSMAINVLASGAGMGSGNTRCWSWRKFMTQYLDPNSIVAFTTCWTLAFGIMASPVMWSVLEVVKWLEKEGLAGCSDQFMGKLYIYTCIYVIVAITILLIFLL